MFCILIPNYNNSFWLDKLFTSILEQDFRDYKIVFVDDISTDESVSVASKWKLRFEQNGNLFYLLRNTVKKYNGGSRNVGLEYVGDSDYVIFIDSDDYFASRTCLTSIKKAVDEYGRPDLIRLSYYFKKGNNKFLVDLRHQKDIASIVNDNNVACWTKCVRTDKVIRFPENTLMEDVVQHIEQLDSIETVGAADEGIIVWNRDNENSCSQNHELQNKKWQSSLYRYFADLLDLRARLVSDVAKAQLEARISATLDNIHKDVFLQ